MKSDSKYKQAFRVSAYARTTDMVGVRIEMVWTTLAVFNSYLNAKAFVDTLETIYPQIKIEKLWVPR